MQNPTQKFGQSSIFFFFFFFFEKPGSLKACSRFVSFCLDLELFAKIKKYLVSTHRNQVYQYLKIKTK